MTLSSRSHEKQSESLPTKEFGASDRFVILRAFHRLPRFHDMGDGSVIQFFDHGSFDDLIQ